MTCQNRKNEKATEIQEKDNIFMHNQLQGYIFIYINNILTIGLCILQNRKSGCIIFLKPGETLLDFL